MKRTCLVIPGNPAVAGYYETWMKEIESQNEELQMVYATSYVLFPSRLNYRTYDREMTKHYEGILSGLDSPQKIVIMAHSVGSYFALRLLEKYPEKIERIIIMFPYIGYSTIQSLRFIWPLYMADRLLPLSALVARCKNTLYRWDKEVKNISNAQLTACLRFGVRQCAYFNTYKFDTRTVSVHRDKVHFIYTEGDRWCPPETIELLKPISHHQRVDIPHDFIVAKNTRDKMTSIIMPYLS